MVITSSQNVGAVSSAEAAEPWARLAVNTIVFTHTSTSTAQPQNRCVASKLSCRLARELGRAMNTITTIRPAATAETATTATSTPPFPAAKP